MCVIHLELFIKKLYNVNNKIVNALVIFIYCITLKKKEKKTKNRLIYDKKLYSYHISFVIYFFPNTEK